MKTELRTKKTKTTSQDRHMEEKKNQPQILVAVDTSAQRKARNVHGMCMLLAIIQI